MIDEMTEDRLRVSTDGIAGPYLMVPMSQLVRVRELLDRHAVPYWVDSDAISLDRKPAIAVINFGRAGDANRIQTLLDKAG
jgi:hypothetical protein